MSHKHAVITSVRQFRHELRKRSFIASTYPARDFAICHQLVTGNAAAGCTGADKAARQREGISARAMRKRHLRRRIVSLVGYQTGMAFIAALVLGDLS